MAEREPEYVTRDQHRADLAELRLELANTLATLDKRTELITQDLAGLRRDTERWHGELRQDMRTLQSTVTRQMWTMISVVAFAVLVGVIKLVFFP